jgi:ribosomal protein L11 methyltransferase
MNSYQEFTITCHPDFNEILIAEFSALGFDTFQENETGFITYFEGDFDFQLLADIRNQYADSAGFLYVVKETVKQNWNTEWEKNYDPIVIDKTCVVKAAFHTNLPSYPIELIITPKMSFGTGHHETTHLMLAEMLTIDFKKTKVLDAGTGTGVLAILAKKQGATSVLAFDIDDWCVENTTENAISNEVEIEVIKASIEDINIESDYNVVLANINKNILLSQIKWYKQALKTGGELLLSGFYLNDLVDIKQSAINVGLTFRHYKVRNNWAMARFIR